MAQGIQKSAEHMTDQAKLLYQTRAMHPLRFVFQDQFKVRRHATGAHHACPVEMNPACPEEDESQEACYAEDQVEDCPVV